MHSETRGGGGNACHVAFFCSRTKKRQGLALCVFIFLGLIKDLFS